MLKRYLPLLLVLLCLLSLPVSADWLPEEDPIGETIVIEEDENIIKDNLDKETENDENKYEPDIPEIIDMTKEAYFDRCIKPFLILFCGGILLFLVMEGILWLRQKVTS